MASLETNLTIGGTSSLYTPGQPANVTLTLFNPTAAAITVTSIAPFATSNSNPYAGVIFGTPTSPGNSATVPAGGSLVYSFGLILTTPQGSAETGTAQANCATAAVTVGVSVYTNDSNVVSPTVVLTPSQMGTTVPSAAATGPGQFVFSNPSNSCNWALV